MQHSHRTRGRVFAAFLCAILAPASGLVPARNAVAGFVAHFPATPTASQSASKYDETMQQAFEALEKGDLAAAERLAFTLTILDETRWEGYALLGSAYGRQGSADKAAQAFAEAKQRAPESERGAIDDLARESVPSGAVSPSDGNITMDTGRVDAGSARDAEPDDVEPVKAPRSIGRTKESELSPASRRSWNTLKLILEDYENTIDDTKKTKFGWEFIGKALPLLEAEPDFIPAWAAYASMAIDVDAPDSGFIAGRRLRLLGLEESDDAALQRLFAQLDRKGWLGEQIVWRDFGKWTNEQIEAAAEAGDLNAMDIIAVAKEGSNRYPKNLDEALEWSRRAASAGGIAGMQTLAGLTKDPNEFHGLLGRLARLGSTREVRVLRERAGSSEECARQYVLYLESMDRLGDAASTYQLAVAYRDGDFGVAVDLKRAFGIMKRAAEAGKLEAINDLGVLYGTGRGVEQDEVAARACYQRATDAGDATAMGNLAYMILNGFGGPKDVSTAIRMLQEAAKGGNGRSAYRLAVLHRDGSPELPADPVRAREWSLLAAERGDVDGALIAANMLRRGLGGPANEVEAERLLRGGMERNAECAWELVSMLLPSQAAAMPVDVSAPSRFASLTPRQLEGLGILGGLLQGTERTDDLIERERVASRHLSEIMLAAVQAFEAQDATAFDGRISDAQAALAKFNAGNAQVQIDVALAQAILALRTGDIDLGWKAIAQVRRGYVDSQTVAEMDAASIANLPVGPRRMALERLVAAGWTGRAEDEAAAAAAAMKARRAGPTKALADDGYTVESYEPDPAVVTDVVARAKIVATGLPWKIRHRKSGIVLLLVPAGGFMMGSSVEDRTESVRSAGWLDAIGKSSLRATLDRWEVGHARTIRNPFYLAQREVSQAEWIAIMGSSPAQFAGNTNPVEQVSWTMVSEFLAKSGGKLRLPSEAEWEYACRAGQATPYSFGARIAASEVNFDGSKVLVGGAVSENRKKTVACGSLPANRWGFHEMHGNVFEWCADQCQPYPKEGDETAVANGDGSRVLRGGSWFANPVDCRSASRFFGQPNAANPSWGFRVSRDAGALMTASKTGTSPAASGSADPAATTAPKTQQVGSTNGPLEKSELLEPTLQKAPRLLATFLEGPVNGRDFDLATQRRPTLIQFFALKSEPCKSLFADVAGLSKEMQGSADVVIIQRMSEEEVALASSNAKQEVLSRLNARIALQENGAADLTNRLALDSDRSIVTAWGVESVPCFFLVASDGTIVKRWDRATKETLSDIRDAIRRLASGGLAAVAMALPGVRAPSALTTASKGLQWVDIEVGRGAQPRGRRSEVVVHYTGYLMDGTKFDSSFDKGQPATFRLDGVIAGWAEGVLSMRAGGKRKLVVPPELAYGEAGRGPIPASATLVFDIELIEVKD